MGLGNRNARRHETARTAGVNPADYWDFKPGQTVMTVDGFLGTVEAVNDGPLAGTEEYEVSLKNGLGGGIYTASQLKAATDHTAKDNTASLDYPELAEVLVQRPDIGRYPHTTVMASRTAATHPLADEETNEGKPPGVCNNGHLTWGEHCPACRDAEPGQNAMVVNEGDNKPQDVENVRNASVTAGYLDEDTEDWHDEGESDEEPQDLRHCPRCGQYADRQTGHHPGNDGPCPNARPTEDDVFDRLDPSKYCGEHCQSGHAADIVHGVGGHHTFHVDEQEYAPHGTSRAEITGPYDEPAERRPSGYEVRDPDAQGLCHYCRGPLPHSPLRVLDDLGSPQERHFLQTNPTGPSKFSALDHGYALVAVAAKDPSFAFHITAAWKDVRAKAQRIRTEGGVHITTSQNGYVIASVKGDHGVYESVLMRVPGTQKVGQWDCGCKWAKYHWGAPDDYSRFAGRMCSHALALHFEAQSRGMFGREVATDTKVPRWLTQNDVGRTASLDLPDCAPIHIFAAHALAAGEDADELALLLSTVAAVSSPFGEPGPSQVPHVPGPTAPRNPSENPASAGFLTAADPQGWNRQNPSDLGDRIASLEDSMFEPEMAVEATLEPREAWAQLIVPLVRTLGPKVLKTVGPAVVDKALSGGKKDDEQPQQDRTQQVQEQAAADAEGGADALNEQAQMAQQTFADPWGKKSVLHDEPEPALPTTEGAEDDEDITWSGYAGDPDPDPHTAAGIPTGVEYAMPTDEGPSTPAVTNPGMGLKDVDDEALSPESPSMQTVGSVEDIVAEFQRTAGASALMSGGPAAAADGMDIAAAAKAHLSKEAMAVFTPAQQQELINEGENVRAANLDRLQIEGTHYEALDAAMGAEDDDQSWLS